MNKNNLDFDPDFSSHFFLYIIYNNMDNVVDVSLKSPLKCFFSHAIATIVMSIAHVSCFFFFSFLFSISIDLLLLSLSFVLLLLHASNVYIIIVCSVVLFLSRICMHMTWTENNCFGASCKNEIESKSRFLTNLSISYVNLVAIVSVYMINVYTYIVFFVHQCPRNMTA